MTDRKRRREDDWFGFDMDEEFERILRRMERMMGDAIKNRELPTERPFVYGFSMRSGPNGKPQVREFGNTKYFDVDQKEHEREPLTDIIDKDENIAVTVELPGVEKDDIELGVHEDSLTISVNTDKRRYYKELQLPSAVAPDSAKATYKNGVLDIVLKKSAGKKKGKKVRID
ncbi:MAG: Hsp20/alpha crystallin family protein [Thermoplasmata archaeon]|nr:Hsp20/alpha crystallin family protein [Thermoplasmata archaeon]